MNISNKFHTLDKEGVELVGDNSKGSGVKNLPHNVDAKKHQEQVELSVGSKGEKQKPSEGIALVNDEMEDESSPYHVGSK